MPDRPETEAAAALRAQQDELEAITTFSERQVRRLRIGSAQRLTALPPDMAGRHCSRQQSADAQGKSTVSGLDFIADCG